VQLDADNMIFFTTTIVPIFQTYSMSAFLVGFKHFEESPQDFPALHSAPQPFCIILNIELDP